MSPRKDRIPVVFDTNLFITRFLKHKRKGVNRRVIDLWQVERRLQLIVSPPIIDEYLYVLENYIGISATTLELLKQRLKAATNITRINPGKRMPLGRDPKDYMFLEAAHTGKAKFLITRDSDLLDIPAEELRGYRFKIITPFDFLQIIEE